MINKLFRSAGRALALVLALLLVTGLTFTVFARSVSAEGDPDGMMGITSTQDDPDAPTSSDGKDGDTGDAPGEIPTTGNTEEDPDGSADPESDSATEEAEEKDPVIDFILPRKLKKVTAREWVFFASALVIVCATVVFLIVRKKKGPEAELSAETKVKPSLILVHGALCIALSFVLSYIKLFSIMGGGSITLASMLPLMVFSNRYGLKWGLLACVAYGMLQFFQKPEITHWAQVVIDYPVAFGLIGFGGLTKGLRRLPFSVLIGGLLRFAAHFVSGMIFYAAYVPVGDNVVHYSFIQNALYMFPEIAICLVIALIPPFRNAIKKALKY